MIVYILKSATCLGLLLAFYYLVLEKEKMHKFNRLYLLGSVLFSFLAPLYIIYIDVAPLILETTQTTTFFYPTEINSEIIEEKTIDYTLLFIMMYSIISSILLIRFGKNLLHLIYKIKKNTKINFKKAVLVLVEENILPHTFWNYIFINKNDYENQKIEQELFTHELTHVTQKHTLDILVLEFLQAIFWINPFFILLKKAVQLNHEFLADETVINQHKNTIQYQHLLLNKAAWKNDYYLASNFNYSLTKKRLKMMTTKSSQTKIWLKKVAVIPLLASFIFLFAERVEAQEIIEEKEKPIEAIVEEVSSTKQDLYNSEIYKEYALKDAFFIHKDKNGKKIKRKYSELSNEEKKNEKVIPLEFQKKIPTNKLIENLKDINKYTVWIDEKVIKNDELNKYKASDFSNYSLYSIDKKAKSKNFTQDYQAYLTTNKLFAAHNKKRVNDFLKFLNEKNNIIEIKEEVKTDINEINFKKDSIKFHKDWFITINNQKYFYTFDKNERVARYYKNNKIIDLDIVKEYKKKQQIFENLKASGKHYVFKSEKEKAAIDREFSDLGGMYFRMSRNDKNKVTRSENPVKPYLTLRKNNKVFYKLEKDLTEEDKLLIPPPPPNPNATKEEIIKAKNAYEDWKKRTGNDFAPKPIKTNNKNLKQNVPSDKTTQKGNQLKTIEQNNTIQTKNDPLNKNIYISENEIKVYSISKLTGEENTELTKNKHFFLDDKKIAFKDLKNIKDETIKNIQIYNNSDGSKSMYITSKSHL